MTDRLIVPVLYLKLCSIATQPGRRKQRAVIDIHGLPAYHKRHTARRSQLHQLTFIKRNLRQSTFQISRGHLTIIASRAVVHFMGALPVRSRLRTLVLQTVVGAVFVTAVNDSTIHYCLIETNTRHNPDFTETALHSRSKASICTAFLY